MHGLRFACIALGLLLTSVGYHSEGASATRHDRYEVPGDWLIGEARGAIFHVRIESTDGVSIISCVDPGLAKQVGTLVALYRVTRSNPTGPGLMKPVLAVQTYGDARASEEVWVDSGPGDFHVGSSNRGYVGGRCALIWVIPLQGSPETEWVGLLVNANASQGSHAFIEIDRPASKSPAQFYWNHSTSRAGIQSAWDFGERGPQAAFSPVDPKIAGAFPGGGFTIGGTKTLQVEDHLFASFIDPPGTEIRPTIRGVLLPSGGQLVGCTGSAIACDLHARAELQNADLFAGPSGEYLAWHAAMAGYGQFMTPLLAWAEGPLPPGLTLPS